MMAALEAALSAQSSKYATVSQQLRLELKEAVAKASQVRTADDSMCFDSLPAGMLLPLLCVSQQPVCTHALLVQAACCCSWVALAVL
jgi:hypothetical protein